MKEPKVTATVTPSGIVVKLENWEGVTNMMIEHIHYATVKQAQVWRAQRLGALHKEKMDTEAAVRATEESKKLNEELEHAIQ